MNKFTKGFQAGVTAVMLVVLATVLLFLGSYAHTEKIKEEIAHTRSYVPAKEYTWYNCKYTPEEEAEEHRKHTDSDGVEWGGFFEHCPAPDKEDTKYQITNEMF